LLVVIGVREDGQKVLLALKTMGGETTEAWRAVLDDLVAFAFDRLGAQALLGPAFDHLCKLQGEPHRVCRLGVKVLAVEELCDWHSVLAWLDHVTHSKNRPKIHRVRVMGRTLDATDMTGRGGFL
jgi:hypothetical protein